MKTPPDGVVISTKPLSQTGWEPVTVENVSG